MIYNLVNLLIIIELYTLFYFFWIIHFKWVNYVIHAIYQRQAIKKLIFLNLYGTQYKSISEVQLKVIKKDTFPYPSYIVLINSLFLKRYCSLQRCKSTKLIVEEPGGLQSMVLLKNRIWLGN